MFDAIAQESYLLRYVTGLVNRNRKTPLPDIQAYGGFTLFFGLWGAGVKGFCVFAHFGYFSLLHTFCSFRAMRKTKI
jgi:hypothetical protein